MGQVFSTLVAPNVVAEIFMIKYMSQRGITPDNMELIPGGELRATDTPDVWRHKFKVGLQRQRILTETLREVQKSSLPSRHMSPCMIREVYKVQDEESPLENLQRESEIRSTVTGLGTLEKLVSDTGTDTQSSVQLEPVEFSSEEIVAYDVVKDAQRKRARSRPEPRQRRLATESKAHQRQTMSVTQITNEPAPHLLTPLKETPSYVIVERIQLGAPKKLRKVWPTKSSVRNVLKDPRNRPTSFFLARFQPAGPENGEPVEVDCRYNKITGNGSFQFTSGSLEKLLEGEALKSYLQDKENNNAEIDEQALFFKHFPDLFRRLDGRIWWNGFTISLEGESSNRLNLDTVTMDPPAFIFDLKGLLHLSATRNDNRISFVGNNQDEHGKVIGDGSNITKKFTMRGKTEQDVKLCEIKHIKQTTLVSITLPALSGIPVSTKLSGSKVGDSSRSTLSTVMEQKEEAEE